MARKRNGISELPDDTKLRIKAIIAKSFPNPDKPKLTEETEKKLNDIELEQRTAVCYADAEETAFRLRKIAKMINNDELIIEENEDDTGTVD